MDSGDNGSSSDDSGSKTGHETSSATKPTCAVSLGVSSSNECKTKNTVIGGEDEGGLVAAALNLRDHQDGWLDIDHLPDSVLEFEDTIAEDKCQTTGNIEDNLASNGVKDGQAKDGSQKIEHHISVAVDGPGDECEVGHDMEDAIADSVTDDIEVDGKGSHGKEGYTAGLGGDDES